MMYTAGVGIPMPSRIRNTAERSSVGTSNPPETALAEVYQVPLPGFSPRGGDVDSNGVYWSALASGHLGSFDRRKCKVLNGPTATGDHCPEGWSFYQYTGPGFEGLGENSAELLLGSGRDGRKHGDEACHDEGCGSQHATPPSNGVGGDGGHAPARDRQPAYSSII